MAWFCVTKTRVAVHCFCIIGVSEVGNHKELIFRATQKNISCTGFRGADLVTKGCSGVVELGTEMMGTQLQVRLALTRLPTMQVCPSSAL